MIGSSTHLAGKNGQCHLFIELKGWRTYLKSSEFSYGENTTPRHSFLEERVSEG